MTEKSAEHFIPGEDELDTEQSLINFNVNDKRIAEAKDEFKDVDAYKDHDGAKAAKKVLTKMRTTLAEAHKEQKADALAFGRRLDTEKNRLLALIAEVEDPISEQLTAIKEKAEREEQERLDAIEDRLAELQGFADDRHDLDLDELKARRAELDAYEITEEVFQEFTDRAQLYKDDADTKLSIAIQRATEAIEELEKQAKIAEDNAAKTKELEERQAKMDVEEAERKSKQAERDEAASFRAAEEQAERQRKLDVQAEAQRKAQEKLDADKAERDRESAEAAALAERLAQAPDVDKLVAFARQIDDVIETKPTLTTEAGNMVLLDSVADLITVNQILSKRIEELK